jgi:hypothetical protein
MRSRQVTTDGRLGFRKQRGVYHDLTTRITRAWQQAECICSSDGNRGKGNRVVIEFAHRPIARN